MTFWLCDASVKFCIPLTANAMLFELPFLYLRITVCSVGKPVKSVVYSVPFFFVIDSQVNCAIFHSTLCWSLSCCLWLLQCVLKFGLAVLLCISLLRINSIVFFDNLDTQISKSQLTLLLVLYWTITTVISSGFNTFPGLMVCYISFSFVDCLMVQRHCHEVQTECKG